MDLGIHLSVWPWIWMALAVVLALAETFVLRREFVLLPWAASAFVAGVLAFFYVAIAVQWAVFLIGGAVVFVALNRWAKRLAARQRDGEANEAPDRSTM